MTDLNRREALQVIGVASLAAAFDWTPAQSSHAAASVRAARDRVSARIIAPSSPREQRPCYQGSIHGRRSSSWVQALRGWQ